MVFTISFCRDRKGIENIWQFPLSNMQPFGNENAQFFSLDSYFFPPVIFCFPDFIFFLTGRFPAGQFVSHIIRVKHVKLGNKIT